MRKRVLWTSVAGVVALMIVCTVFASNMIFKLSVSLFGPAGGSTGTQLIALPFNQQTSLTNADDLLNDISLCTGPANVSLVARFVRSTETLSSYTCSGGENFTLAKGDAYYVKVNADQPYLIVGTHDPSFSVALSGPSGGTTGTNPYAYPYHSVAFDAEELINEISLCPNSTVTLISRFVKSADALSFYTCGRGENFPLNAGEGYLIQVSTDISFVPAHY